VTLAVALAVALTVALAKQPELFMTRRIYIFSILAALAVGTYSGVMLEHHRNFPLNYASIKNEVTSFVFGFDAQLMQSVKPSQAAVECPDDYIGIVGFGQSNIANYVKRQALITDVNHAFMYNWTDGRCYPLSEPLTGADNIYGNVLTDVVINLRSRGVATPVLIAPIAHGATSVFEWYGGDYKLRLDYFLKQTTEQGLDFGFWLWQQGESDAVAQLYATLKRKYYSNAIMPIETAYADALNQIFDRVVDHYPNARFGVSLTSTCFVPGNLHILMGQRQLIESRQDTFLTIYTDKLGAEYRWDGCHFDGRGAQVVGAAYADFVMKRLSTH